MSTCLRVIFAAPRRIEIEVGVPLRPRAEELLVRSECSAISAGSELLAFRGELAPETPRDPVLPSLGGTFRFPFTFGYATTGEVVEQGSSVPGEWCGKKVTGLVPHASEFVVRPDEVWPVPPGMSSERAVFLPNAETAVGLVHDGAPQLGERFLVIGQGVIGLFVAGLLARLPVGRLVTVERYQRRRLASAALGAHACLVPEVGGGGLLDALGGDGADLVFEVTGDPAALDLAIAACGDEGRVVVGSWYGERRVSVDLGTRFHRGRLRLISSQVSRMAPALRGRWDRRRRMEVAFAALARLDPESWISHRVPVAEAAAAYRLLDETPQDCLQVLLTYG